ncbi:MAG: glycoside hydrolase family 10 [Pedosphaera sp.]|nr:glycoside hydrolase family 10 [Pedosphaera sp.]
MKLIRRLFAFLLLACVSVAHTETLKDAAAQFPSLRLGTAVNPSILTGSDVAYANTLRLHYQLPSPENALKWGALRPDEYSYNWADADTIAGFAVAAGRRVRGHTLVWHQSIPAWVTNGGFTTDQARDLLFHHIDTVAGRYRGNTLSWDVVNEAFNDNGTLRTSFWYNQPGIGYAADGTRYIEEAFKRANVADPGKELIYNDYNIETVNAKSDALYAMAQDFLNRGVPLNGIGFQMHISSIDYTSLRTNFQRFNGLGLDLHITEMDVRIPVDTNGVATQADLNAQAEVYWNVLGVALGQPHFTVFQTWGFTDKYSWIPGFFPGYGAALPFDSNYQRKPAYWAIWNALANQAEKLPVLDFTSGDTTNIFSQGTLSAGAGLQLLANGANDYMTLAVPIPYAGPWDVKVGYRQSGASGKFQLAVAPVGGGSFTSIGGVVDAYGATIGAGVTDLGTNNFSSAGNWQFRFTVTGRNASASAYNITIDYIRITPAGTNANTPPTISTITDKSAPENTLTGPFAFTIGDAQTSAAALTMQAVSLNTNLLPTANILLGGSGASRTVTLTPATNHFGTATILLLVSDGTNQTPETFTLNVTAVNTPPNVLATNLTLPPNTSVDVNLLPLVSDVETPATAMRYDVSAAVGGTVTLLLDGHTARFTAATNYLGAASFRYTATDTGPDARWLLHYNFEPLDAADDKSVTDNSAGALTGTLEEYGNGLSVYDTNVPASLAPFSTHSLSLTESGSGNGARLETLLSSNTYSLQNSDWTMVAWFRRTTATNDDYIFHIGTGDGYSGDGDELDLDLVTGGQLQLRHYDTANAQDVSIASGIIPTGEWHHTAVVFDRTNNNAGLLMLYLDGVQVGTSTPVNWSLNQGAELVFGGVKKGNEARWLNGNLDDIALYRALLTPVEITTLAGGRTVAQLGGLSRSNTVSVTLQFTNQPPVLAGISNAQLIAGVPLAISPNASDPDVPAQTLIYSLLSAPPGTAINPTNGLITWRPTIAQSGTSNLFKVMVTEAGWFTNVMPLADAYVRDGSYANSNYGADTILTVKQSTTDFTRESFLRFVLPWFPGTLADAQLLLQPVYVSLPGTQAVALVTNDVWDEATLTWNTKPVSGLPLATWLPQTNLPVQVSITSAIQQDLAANGLLSLRIYATNSTADGLVNYASKEAGAALVPQLYLLYTNAPSLSTTQSFWVTVSAPQRPVFSGMQFTNGVFSMNVAGDGGPDYTVLISTNLLNWDDLFMTNGSPGLFTFGVTDIVSTPQKFYRIRLGP